MVDLVSIAVFGFAAVAGCCFVIALQRFRLAFNAYIDNINRLDGPYKVSIKDTSWPSTIGAMIALVVVTVLVSLSGAIYAAVGR